MKRFVYDLLLPKGPDGSSSFQPKPLDGEVEKFEVCGVVGIWLNARSLVFLASFPRRGDKTDERRALQTELRSW